MIQVSIDAINARITAQLGSQSAQVGGLAIPFYDQQENATSLRLSDESKRLTMNSKLAWQSAHLTDGSRPVKQQTWGSFNDTTHDVRFVLTGLSNSPLGMDLAMRALDGVRYVVVDDYDDRTMSVLQRYWQVKTNQDKNYDPDLYAFAIKYHLVGVTDDDFVEPPVEIQAAVLIGDTLTPIGTTDVLGENVFPYYGQDETSVTIGPNQDYEFVLTDTDTLYPSVMVIPRNP